ncbi:MAG TPA: hypothetical protein V6D30_14900 [Leptolyngbyaceae cyanobacterium]
MSQSILVTDYRAGNSTSKYALAGLAIATQSQFEAGSKSRPWSRAHTVRLRIPGLVGV